MKIKNGCTVTIDYTMTLENGEVIDSTQETDPLSYTQGDGEILTGLESILLGKEKGESLDVAVPATEGFGESDPEAIIEIPKRDIPHEALKTGMEIQGEGPQGQSIAGTVVELKEDRVTVDFNHPLAGKTLHFSVTIVDVV